jgi:hypothetical protein
MGNPGPVRLSAGSPGERAMNVDLAMAVASFITGFVLGWLIASIALSARMSWSQERMERRVRYWRDLAQSRDPMVQPSRQLADSPAWDDLVN